MFINEDLDYFSIRCAEVDVEEDDPLDLQVDLEDADEDSEDEEDEEFEDEDEVDE